MTSFGGFQQSIRAFKRNVGDPEGSRQRGYRRRRPSCRSARPARATEHKRRRPGVRGCVRFLPNAYFHHAPCLRAGLPVPYHRTLPPALLGRYSRWCLSFSGKDGYKHFAIRLRRWNLAWGRCRFPTHRDNLVCEVLGMKLLVGNFREKKLRQLRSIWTSRFCRIGEILDDGSKLTGQVIV